MDVETWQAGADPADEGEGVMASEKIKAVELALKRNWATIKGTVPASVTPERLVRIAVTAINLDQHLEGCSVDSLVTAIVKSAMVGIEPNDGTGRAYIVPYKGDAQFQLGYKGLIDLAYRSGLVEFIDCQVVYEGDDFDCELGSSPFVRHRPVFEHGPMKGVYAVLVPKGSTRAVIEIMGLDDIAKIKKMSKGSRADRPWIIWEEEMARKGPLKRVCKRGPCSIELHTAIGFDNESEGIDIESVMPGVLDGNGKPRTTEQLKRQLKQKVTVNADGSETTMAPDPHGWTEQAEPDENPDGWARLLDEVSDTGKDPLAWYAALRVEHPELPAWGDVRAADVPRIRELWGR